MTEQEIAQVVKKYKELLSYLDSSNVYLANFAEAAISGVESQYPGIEYYSHDGKCLGPFTDEWNGPLGLLEKRDD